MRLFGNRPMDEVVPGLIGLSLSSGVLLWSIAWIAFGLTARAWPTAEAEILECRFESSKRQRQGLRYYLRLRYRYSVGGKTYEGGRLHFGAAIETHAGASMGKVRMRTPGIASPSATSPSRPACARSTRESPGRSGSPSCSRSS